MSWEVVIGLETHAQLSTASKIFSGASTAFGAPPNTQASPVDIALPGVLPVLNRGAVERAIRFGLAVGATINTRSVFARKNYFYPDLPKGYQISQYEIPVVQGGSITFATRDGEKTVRLTRAHLEEDAGKSLHEGLSAMSRGMSGIDLNRAGTPLLEIVSEPDMRSAQEAVAYAKMLHALVRWSGICDGNMQEGSFRCDANVSVRRTGDATLGTRCEIKNLNSFRFLEKAIEHEARRQIERIKAELPELPIAMKMRFETQYDLSPYEAATLTASREMAAYFEDAVRAIGGDAKMVSNWLLGEVSAALNRSEIEIAQAPVSPAQLASLLKRLQDSTISGKIAKDVFDALWAGECEGDPDAIIERKGLKQISDAGAIEKIVDDVIAANPSIVAELRAGRQKAFNSLVGKAMAESNGKANPAQVNAILKRKLER